MPYFLALVMVATAVFLAPERSWAQHNDRRAGGGSVPRALDRKEPLLLRNLFGKRKTTSEAAPVEPGIPPGQEGAPVAPAAAPGSPTVEIAPVAPAGSPASATGGTGPVAPADSAKESVSAAINKLAGQSGGDVISSASKMLEGNREELKTLARSVEGDPAKLLTEGKKLLQDPKISASARQALEAVARPGGGGAGSKVTAPSLDEMKHLAEKVMADPNLVQGGKQLLSENPKLLEQGKELLKENKGMLDGESVKQLMDKLPEVGGELVKPVVIPTPAVMPAGPLPPWVGAGVPAPRDPVADPIPRPEVPPDQITRITAQFARFDANTNVVTFEEDVELNHKEFDMSCQVLVAELKPGKEGVQPDPNLAKAQAAAGGIRRATAKGYVIIQKISPEGKIQVAKSREAVYDAESGDVVLSDFPQLQDGNNLISGAAQTTKIFLRKSGKYEVKGLAEYQIVPEGGGDPLKTLQR